MEVAHRAPAGPPRRAAPIALLPVGLVEDDLRFYIDQRGKVRGPVTDDDVREALRDGKLGADDRVRLEGTALWASPRAFATLARSPGAARPTLPSAPASVLRELPADLGGLSGALRDVLLFWVHDGAPASIAGGPRAGAPRPHTIGPISGAELRRGVEAGQHQHAAASLVDSGAWYPATLVAPRRDPSVVPAVQPTRESSISPAETRSPPRAVYLGAAAEAPASSATPRASGPASASAATVRCPICLERIAATHTICPECGESAAAQAPAPGGPPSIPDHPPNASWLSMHWRPLVMMGVMTAVVCSGIALRHLAPGRFLPARAGGKAAPSAAAPAACSPACWNGEACKEGRCVWQPPNDVGHVAAGSAAPIVGGPFPLPRDVTDALPLDGERFAVSLLTGLEVRNARTGGVLSLVTDAPQSRRLYRVGAVVYATAPQRIYVVDAATTRLLKTIETGSAVGEVTVGASGRRALASLPAAHAVAVLATEYHAEIDRIQFGDDSVGPMGADDTGKRALTTTGQIPLPGLRDPQGGAVYAFDPSRLASAQDRVRGSMVGNPVSLLMTPDGQTSFVVLRAEDALVPLSWQPSGAVQQEARIPTCREPEQIELGRRGRLGIVRCNEGHAIEIFDLARRELVRHVPFNARVADMAVSPDGKQVVVALPADGAGFVGLVDLESFAVKVLPVTAEPTRVRLAPDGSVALVLSDRAKVAWVIR
jgi:DNA-binding beta-propeller fold protein YncE